jgi:hypothetical protein
MQNGKPSGSTIGKPSGAPKDGVEHDEKVEDVEETAAAGRSCVAGRDSVSATTLESPEMCLTSAENSAMKDNWRRCLSDLGSDSLAKAPTSGLWSVNITNFRPSSMC